MAIFEIINSTDSLIQNIIRIVFFCWLIFDILNQKPWRPGWITRTKLSKSNKFSRRLMSETKPETSNFYFISETSKPLSAHSFKKNLSSRKFSPNVPNPDKTNAPIFSSLKFQEVSGLELKIIWSDRSTHALSSPAIRSVYFEKGQWLIIRNSIGHQYWNMAQGFQEKNCKPCFIFWALSSQKWLEYKENTTKYRCLSSTPRCRVRILI